MQHDSTLAFVFPGQGSQPVGMLADVAAVRPSVVETFAEASDALGKDLWNLVQNGPEAELNQTHNTQPAMLTAGVALWRLWREEGGPYPAFMAGHSLGEYTALVCADALDFADAVALVASRGRLMQQAVPLGQGKVTAVLGLGDSVVEVLCKEAAQGEVVAAVNLNAPGQVVIAGETRAVERVEILAKDRGAKRVMPLAVSVPVHCELMRPAAEKLAQRLAEVSIQPAGTAVIHNVDVKMHVSAEAIRDALVRQLYSPVRWSETIAAIAQQGVTTVVECGPGRVLAGLNRRIVRQMQSLPIFDPASLNKALAAVRGE